MSNFLKRFSKEKKNYKELYEIELNNRQKYEKRYREKCKDYVNLQKEKGLPELKKALMEITNERDFLKEDRAKLYIQLEDARNELELLKQPKKRGRKKKEIKDGE